MLKDYIREHDRSIKNLSVQDSAKLEVLLDDVKNKLNNDVEEGQFDIIFGMPVLKLTKGMPAKFRIEYWFKLEKDCPVFSGDIQFVMVDSIRYKYYDKYNTAGPSYYISQHSGVFSICEIICSIIKMEQEYFSIHGIPNDASSRMYCRINHKFHK